MRKSSKPILIAATSLVLFAIDFSSAAALTCKDTFDNSALIKGAIPPATPVTQIKQVENFRGLETDSPERKAWLDAQNKFANTQFRNNPWTPHMEKFFRNLYEKQNVITSAAGSGFKLELIDRGLGKPVELVSTIGETKRVLFNSYDIKRNGSVNVQGMQLDPSQNHVIVATTRNGSIDTFELHIYNIRSGQLKEVVRDAGSGTVDFLTPHEFVYRRYINRDAAYFKHKIGFNQSRDLLAETGTWYENLGRNFVAKYTEQNGKEKASIKRLTDDRWYELDIVPRELISETANELIVRTEGSDLKGEIRVVSVNDGKSRLLLGEQDQRMRTMAVNGDKLIGTFSWGEKQSVRIFNRDGVLEHTIDLPSCCSVLHATLDTNQNTVNIVLGSSIRRMETVQFDLSTQRFTQDVEKLLLTDDKGVRFITDVIQAKSADGEIVPVRVVYREGTKLDGNNPVMMEGYGGFGISGHFNPRFTPISKEFLDRGGISANPALRGGDEFGRKWAEGSQKLNKQNTFNDFIAASEALIAGGYTKPGKIGAMGWSNGGLLMGALGTQRPDLFGVLVPGAGVHDMLRKERLDPKFDNGWSYEYGSSDNVSIWNNLNKYAPVRSTLKKRAYPTILVVTGNNDSRVNPVHSYKLAAELQRVQTGKKPIMLVNTKNGGHWITSEDRQDYIAWRTSVRIWSTVFKELGIETPAEKN